MTEGIRRATRNCCRDISHSSLAAPAWQFRVIGGQLTNLTRYQLRHTPFAGMPFLRDFVGYRLCCGGRVEDDAAAVPCSVCSPDSASPFQLQSAVRWLAGGRARHPRSLHAAPQVYGVRNRELTDFQGERNPMSRTDGAEMLLAGGA